MSGKALAVILLVVFQILLVRLADAKDYSTYAVLIAVTSTLNTLASLGSQRLIPKYLGYARSNAVAHQTLKLVLILTGCRLAAVIVLTLLTFLITSKLQISTLYIATISLPLLLALSISSVLYMDAELSSQSLNQQKLSRAVIVFDGTFRNLAIISIYYLGLTLNPENIIYCVVIGQAIASAVLFSNVIKTLIGRAKSEKEDDQLFSRKHIIGAAASGYIGGIISIASAPSTLRLVAATFLNPVSLTIFSFLQTIFSSLQRYTPGVLIMPFVEPWLMAKQGAAQSKHRDVGTILSIIIKTDVLLLSVVCCAAIFLGRTFIKLTLGVDAPETSAIIALMIAYLALSTAFRCLEVFQGFNASYRSLYVGSIISCIFLTLLFIYREAWGVWGILLVPIADGICRIIYFDLHSKSKTGIALVDWRTCATLISMVTAIYLIAQRFPAIFDTATKQLISTVVALLIFTAIAIARGILSKNEANFLREKMPKRQSIKKIIGFLES